MRAVGMPASCSRPKGWPASTARNCRRSPINASRATSVCAAIRVSARICTVPTIEASSRIDDTRMRPLLLIDEAQELPEPVFAEIRLLAATDFDSRAILSVVFAGDNRLLGKLRRPDLVPLASRIRQRLLIEPAEPGELARLLDHLIEQAGNPALMTAGLKDTLVAHAAGNPRALTVMADALLAAGAEKEREVLDDKLFIETLGEPAKPKRARR